MCQILEPCRIKCFLVSNILKNCAEYKNEQTPAFGNSSTQSGPLWFVAFLHSMFPIASAPQPGPHLINVCSLELHLFLIKTFLPTIFKDFTERSIWSFPQHCLRVLKGRFIRTLVIGPQSYTETKMAVTDGIWGLGIYEALIWLNTLHRTCLQP